MPAPKAASDRTDLVRVRRALLSVSDKTGIVELARRLHARDTEIISTGGTATRILDAGIPVTPVESITGSPEMLDGRVKTLHPMIHGALLARRDNAEHADAMLRHHIEPIDLVVVNLYPFEQTAARQDATPDETIEHIDIGGPSMIRSAAKNHAGVAVVTDPSQYTLLTDTLDANDGATDRAFRRRLAAEAFTRTAAYDAAISAWMTSGDDAFPARLVQSHHRVSTLRYGENPHQRSALYRAHDAPPGTLLDAEQLHGKPMSHNNTTDASAAVELVRAMAASRPGACAACVVKHANPCGAAVGASDDDAIDAAIQGDPLAGFGGILACSARITRAGAERIARDDAFFEVIAAPSYEDDAVRVLRERWANIRVLALGDRVPVITRQTVWIPGGLLLQDRDLTPPDPASWTHAAGPAPDAQTLDAAATLECVVAALGSNAVCIGGRDAGGRVALRGAGAGQMDRVAACRGAIHKAGDRATGAIALSDAFFPFPDGPERLIDAGVATIVHPGGSKRDHETFSLCDQRGVTCLTTGTRHFRH